VAEKLGQAILELRTDSKGYTKEIKGAEKLARDLEKRFGLTQGSLGKFTGGLKTGAIALGIFAAATAAAGFALFKFVQGVAAQGEAIGKAAKRIGIGVEELQKFQFAAETSGSSAQELENGLRRLARAVDEVAQGKTEGSAAALLRLGGSIEQAVKAGEPLEKLLPLIADRFKAMEDPIKKSALAQEIFGSAGTKLIPLLNEGSEGIKELTDQAERYGVLSADVVQKSEDFDDSLTNLKQSMTGLRGVLAQDLLPEFTNAINKTADWIAENRELIGQDVKGFIEGIKLAIDNLKIAFNNFLPGLTGVSSEFGVLTTAIVTVNESLILLQKAAVGVKTLAALGKFAQGDILGARELDRQAKQAVLSIKEQEKALTSFIVKQKGVVEVNAEVRQEELKLDEAQKIIAKSIENRKKETESLIPVIEATTEADKELNKALEEQAQIDEDALGQIESLADQWNEAADTFNMTAGEVRKYTLDTIAANAASMGLSEEGLAAVKKALEDAANAMSRLNFKEAVQAAMEFADELGAGIADSLEKGVEAGEEALDSLDDFIGEVAGNISDTVANMLTAAFTGSFDDITRSWKDMLKNLLNVFAQFASAIITNPIRIALEGVLGGTGGAGGGGAKDAVGGGLGLLGGAGSLFGPSGSFTALGALFSGNSAVGFGATLAGALPAIGLIIGAAVTAISIILPLLKKTPRLDIDFDSVKTELGRRAAVISELLDPDFFKDSIGQVSVKRGGVGLGLGGDEAILDLIQERISDSIESIQAIIAQLPQEIFNKLNETLLSAELDIDTVIGGERFLEFDAKGKKIAEKFQAFIEGELPAKVFASIRETFFLPAFESLGVASEQAQALIDKFLADMQAAGSREERAQIGAEFLQLFDAYVDVFNLINDGVQGVFEKAISDIRAMSAALDIEAANGIPSLGQIQQALEDLFHTGQLTAETAQQFMQLRQAVVDLTLGLAQSISNITSIISQLNTDIVGLGGSAIGTSDFIREAIDQLQGMLDNEALSLDEQADVVTEVRKRLQAAPVVVQATPEIPTPAQPSQREVQTVDPLIELANHLETKVRGEATSEVSLLKSLLASLPES